MSTLKKELMLNNGYIIGKPTNERLISVVDYFYYLNIPTSELSLKEEHIIPFPRITFGYFFNNPFEVTNHSLNENVVSDLNFSKFSTDQISVHPTTEKVRIIGAHLKPYALALFIKETVANQPWIIDANKLFGTSAKRFKQKLQSADTPESMFNSLEELLTENLIEKDLKIIIHATKEIEQEKGEISIPALANRAGVTSRTLRTHFQKAMGCSPKEYLKLVKLKQAVYQMKNSEASLTSVCYDQNYADQSHFTHTLKNITGESPKKIREKIPDFRFLQF